MTRRPPTTRRGVTLTEVLVALFVMALGMTALLTLFPLGAFQIGQALKDDRCTQAALQADGVIRSYWRHQVAAQGGLATNSLVWAMDDPNLTAKWPAPTPPGVLHTYLPPGFRLPTGVSIPNASPGPPQPPISPTQITAERYVLPQPPAVAPDTYYVTDRGTGGAGPSFPVLLDPVGFVARGAAAEHLWAGRGRANLPAPLLIPRRSAGVPFPAGGMYDPWTPPSPPAPVLPQNAAFALCFLTDDLAFEPNGAPLAIDPTTGVPFSGGAQLQRQGRYSWAALIQRPHNDQPAVADLTVLVFDGRSPTAVPIGDEHVVTVAQPPPSATSDRWVVGERSAVVTVPSRTQEQPALVRKGGWVMDGTIDISPMAAPTPGPPIPHPARFYRIVGVTEVSVAPPPGNTTYALDLDVPIQPPPLGVPPPPSSQLYFFANLAEVFPRPPLTPNDR